jgi:hypothetical protein
LSSWIQPTKAYPDSDPQHCPLSSVQIRAFDPRERGGGQGRAGVLRLREAPVQRVRHVAAPRQNYPRLDAQKVRSIFAVNFFSSHSCYHLSGTFFCTNRRRKMCFSLQNLSIVGQLKVCWGGALCLLRRNILLITDLVASLSLIKFSCEYVQG